VSKNAKLLVRGQLVDLRSVAGLLHGRHTDKPIADGGRVIRVADLLRAGSILRLLACVHQTEGTYLSSNI